jgi:hypothetical protein
MPDSIAAESTTRRRRAGGTASLAEQLYDEWQHLGVDPCALRRAERWAITDSPLTHLDQVLTTIGFRFTARHPTHRLDGEEALHSLIVLAGAAGGNDDLAARVVLQRLLPGLIARSVMRRQHTATALDELVGAAWIAIREFNPVRRPRCLAAALLSEADYRAFRQQWRRSLRSGDPTFERLDHEFPAVEPPPRPHEELADVLRSAAEAGMPETDLRLLRQLAATDRVGDLATALDVTPRTIRNRRDRLTVQLRSVLAA